MQNVSPQRLIRIAKTLMQGPPRFLKLARQLLTSKKGLEIGGPSNVFRRRFNLPLYDCVAQLDNCDFSQDNKWASHTPSFQFSKDKSPGKTFFCEGSDLAGISDNSYDFLLSSHNLEHIANPLKALKEWMRVVKPRGHLVVVLPHYARTFDHRRVPTTIDHMVEDFYNGVGEDDLTHVEETFAAHRLNDESQSDEELRVLLLSNYKYRTLHHHVFDEVNSKALMESAGLEVLAVETQLPFHIYLLMQTP